MKKADENKRSTEVSKDVVFIYYFKLKNAVRPKVRYVCTIDCNSGGHVTRSVSLIVTFKYVFLCFVLLLLFLLLDYKSLFLLSE